MPRIPQWAKLVGATALGVAGGSFGAGVASSNMGRDIVDARRVADDAGDGLRVLSPRVTSLELWRATQDERWAFVVETLKELRADVKDLKGR